MLNRLQLLVRRADDVPKDVLDLAGAVKALAGDAAKPTTKIKANSTCMVRRRRCCCAAVRTDLMVGADEERENEVACRRLTCRCRADDECAGNKRVLLDVIGSNSNRNSGRAARHKT